jgi:hypothetical protein
MNLSREHKNDFAAFWAIYPHRVGKLAAERAYEKARRSGTEPAEILAGVQRYVKSKPDWQSWAHPSSWLNAGRWMDEAPQRKRGNRTCPHDPCCQSFTECRDKLLGRKASGVRA